jgi:8-oxo-dGTP pyrophosphatase MutT (NUDIX family)
LGEKLNLRILGQLIAGVIFVFLAVSTFYFANGLYRISPDASAANNLQIPQDGLRTQSEINVTEAIFTIENSSLKLSAIRVANSEGSAIFDVGATVAAPLYPDLNIMYSMYPATAPSVLGLRLFNGTHVIVLQYYVGNEAVEHPYQNYIDVQYQIGNETDTWFRGTRNIWDDLANEGVDVNTSWKTTTVGFGLASFSRGNSTDDTSMRADFELNETQIMYGESILALVDSSSITFSRTAFLGLLVSAAAFVVWSGEYLILLKRTRQNDRKTGAYLSKMNDKSAVLCVDGVYVKHGKMLLLKRATEPFKDYWGLVGGHADGEESLEEALRREFKEETNLEVEIGKRLGERLERSFDRIKRIVTYEVTSAKGKICLSSEHTDYGWFEHIPNNSVYNYAKYLKKQSILAKFRLRD